MTNQPKNKRAAAVPFTEDLAEQILERIAGGESLRAICQGRGMPVFRSVLRWVADRPDFRAAYDFAVDARAQLIGEEILSIADSPEIGTKTKTGPGGVLIEETTGDMVERSKLRVDARKWILARMAPKRFGPRITQEISGPDGGPVRLGSDPVIERAEQVSELIADLRAAIHDPRERAAILDRLPETERDLARKFEACHAAAALVEPPASWRGKGSEE